MSDDIIKDLCQIKNDIALEYENNIDSLVQYRQIKIDRNLNML